jgi:hypothetical protein
MADGGEPSFAVSEELRIRRLRPEVEALLFGFLFSILSDVPAIACLIKRRSAAAAKL